MNYNFKDEANKLITKADEILDEVAKLIEKPKNSKNDTIFVITAKIWYDDRKVDDIKNDARNWQSNCLYELKQNFADTNSSDLITEFDKSRIDDKDKYNDAKLYLEEKVKRGKSIMQNAIERYYRIKQDEGQKPQHTQAQNSAKSNKVFIVHGHDDDALIAVENFVRKIQLKPIILREQADMGRTIIEKIETHTDVSFAIVLYTPCDEGRLQGEGELKARARQNVIFEHGYLCAKLSRKNVCAIVKGEMEFPSDLQGVVYKTMEKGWERAVAKEIKASGLLINESEI